MKHEEMPEVNEVLAQLEQLAPRRGEGPPAPGQALARLQTRLATPRPSFWAGLTGRLTPQFAAVLSVMVLLLIAFSLPPVRAAASDFLGLFRVQKFAPISISPAQLAMLEEIAAGGLTPGELTIITQPDARRVDSLATAAAATNIDLRLPGELAPADEIYTMGRGEAQLTVDLAGARAILETAAVDPLLLPNSLDGAQVNVTTYAGVTQYWSETGLSLSQLPSPEVDYPDDIDLTVLGEALLRLLGLNPAEASRLAGTIDWTSTVLLPIPSDAATFNEVRVDGVSGLALTSLNGAEQALLWQKNGIVYLLEGSGDLADLIAVGNSLR